MWVDRTPEEIARWEQITRRDAAGHAFLIAAPVWLLTTVLGAAGVGYVRGGFIVQHRVLGGFWMRLLLFAVAAFFFSRWVYRSEMRKEWEKSTRRTICPRCDISGDGNAGALCGCGGPFVPQSTMKWVEAE